MIENKTLGPPQLVRMSSGEANRQCDLYPHGSYHIARKDSNGTLWTGSCNAIPVEYPFQLIEAKPDSLIRCGNCKNEFDDTHPFIGGICIRCYERFNFVNREEYRAAIRREILLEELPRLQKTTATDL